MIVYFESRRRIAGSLYAVRSWYLFGVVLLFRRYQQLTIRGDQAVPSEFSL